MRLHGGDRTEGTGEPDGQMPSGEPANNLDGTSGRVPARSLGWPWRAFPPPQRSWLPFPAGLGERRRVAHASPNSDRGPETFGLIRLASLSWLTPPSPARVDSLVKTALQQMEFRQFRLELSVRLRVRRHVDG